MNVIFLSDILLTAIAVIWLFIATIQDIKKREVANWLSFSLLIISLSLRAIVSVISWDVKYFIFGIGSVIIFFGVANLFYYLRIFAGGDAKLLTAIGAAFATSPSFTPLIKNTISTFGFQLNLPFLIVFVINTLFVGSVYGLFFSIFLASKNFNLFRREFVKLTKKYLMQIILAVILAVLFLILNRLFLSSESSVIAVSIVVIIFPFLFAFVKAVENSCMLKLVNTSQLTEGDWLADKIKIGKKVLIPRFDGLSIQEIEMLKKRNKKVLIKQGIPFVPVFLIALIISLFANILELLINFFA